jgi:hypothetical protein
VIIDCAHYQDSHRHAGPIPLEQAAAQHTDGGGIVWLSLFEPGSEEELAHVRDALGVHELGVLDVAADLAATDATGLGLGGFGWIRIGGGRGGLRRSPIRHNRRFDRRPSTRSNPGDRSHRMLWRSLITNALSTTAHNTPSTAPPTTSDG